MRTVAIVPVKRFSQAKRRLGASVATSLRDALVRAMVGDVLDALRACDALAATILVTGEPAVAAAGRRDGALVVSDDADAGQSAAVALGVRAALREGFARVLCVPGDCPTLDPHEIDALLAEPGGGELAQSAPARAGARPRARAPAVTIVPDRHGSGTNGLLLSPPGAIAPSFGPASRARHEALARAAGARLRIATAPSLSLDVDTGADLLALRRRLAASSPRAARTRALLEGAGRRAVLAIGA
jgi:2-phospho-L-lactate/phosphoenolpyruvate guanylyltransferase